ncbi:uncharacterized protein YktB (UPF0637 family) [Pullulanibacillus pueri]|uniref:UPF0637 protein GCM10007096_02350 n=1 Tax=Pullulanibacillus pueri TaxID=1437324 RepID=A0A8J2ZRE2_9BACL|nr:DUF1054 domain-containing protein [Pullulanibacillus pueri]MBM7680083.1 uncharacterized protein YktB (UPF0637 family) [Pullulanibacillus pueri]GGH74285.1 UPF0637 protein YktB [Pullulanibacillus pueri]
MTFTGFTKEDFDVFSIEGLEPRMEALIATVRPKLESLGAQFSPLLTSLTGDEIFPHVAKHARRTVHPPKDTWVAFAADKRGYKKHPHFQIGLWGTHVFVWFAIINEAVHKKEIAERLKAQQTQLLGNLPAKFVWSMDHTQPAIVETFDPQMLERLGTIKKAELLCGQTFSKEQAIERGDRLSEDIEAIFSKLSPLYEAVTKWPVK